MASADQTASSMGLCSKCGKKNADIWTVSPCGHETCSKCLETAGHIESCLECDGKVKSLACPGSGLGCSFDTTKGSWKDHVIKCLFFPLECPNRCGMTVGRKEMLTHLASACELRLTTCQFCQETVFEVEVRDHESSCPKASVSCPYCLRKGIKREEMEQHAKACSETPKPCPLVEFGCSFSGADRDVDQHLTVRNHIDCFREVKRSQQERQQEIDKLQSDLAACRRELYFCKNELAELTHGDGAIPFDKELRWVFQAPAPDFDSFLSPLYRHRGTGALVYFQLKKRNTTTVEEMLCHPTPVRATLLWYKILSGKAIRMYADSTVVLYLLEPEIRMYPISHISLRPEEYAVETSWRNADKEVQRGNGVRPDSYEIMSPAFEAGKQYLMHLQLDY